MIDKLREFAFGSFEERQAGPTLRRLSRKKVLNHKDQEDLKVAQGLSRRLFLKQGSLVVGGTAGVGTGGFGLLKFLFPDCIPTSSASLSGEIVDPANEAEEVGIPSGNKNFNRPNPPVPTPAVPPTTSDPCFKKSL